MKTLSIQTPEDIRRKMIDVFGKAMPSIKTLNSYPLIVIDNPDSSKISQDLNIHWIWLLPNNEAITYGNNGKNRFVFHPKMKDDVYAATNLNISDGIEITPMYGSTAPDLLLAILSVKKVRYQKDNVTFEETVVVVEKAKAEAAEISQLYTKNYDCEYL